MAANTVRNMKQPRAIQSNHMRIRYLETAVVGGNDRIVRHCVLQFCHAADPARDDRIRINSAKQFVRSRAQELRRLKIGYLMGLLNFMIAEQWRHYESTGEGGEQ
jgi:hypothetical protein